MHGGYITIRSVVHGAPNVYVDKRYTTRGVLEAYTDMCLKVQEAPRACNDKCPREQGHADCLMGVPEARESRGHL